MRLVERPRAALYLLLGLVAGLGILSKYSYALFFAALALALLASPQGRKVARSPWILASALVALAVVAPHAWWLLDHWQMASERTLAKMEARPGAVVGALSGLGSLAEAIAGTLVVLVVVWAAVFGRAAWRARSAGPRSAHCVLWLRYLAALAALLAAMVVLGGVGNVKGRWLQPLLCMAPLIWFGCRADLDGHPRLRAYGRVLVGFALVFLTLLTLRPFYDGWRGRPGDLNQPAATLARALEAQGYDGRGTIVASDRVMAGVLRTRFTPARVETWAAGAPPLRLVEGEALLLIAGAGHEAWLRERTAALGVGAHAGVAGELMLPFTWSRPGQPEAKYRFVLVRRR